MLSKHLFLEYLWRLVVLQHEDWLEQKQLQYHDCYLKTSHEIH
jgi:hypothetical protein